MKKIVPINDSWLYYPGFEKTSLQQNYDFSKFYVVNIPHNNTDLPKSYFNEKSLRLVSTYSKVITIPAYYSGYRILLKFEGILSYAEIYVNEIFVASHKGESPFEADITVPVKLDFENRIVIKVDSALRPDVPSAGKKGAGLSYGGFFRDVSLVLEGGETIKNAAVICKDVLNNQKVVEINAVMNDFYPDTTVSALIYDSSKKIVGTIPEKTVLKATASIKGAVSDAVLWSPDNPAIYTAEIILKSGEKTLDIYSVKFGFRSAVFKRGGFYLNGEKTALIGVNREDSFAYAGRAMPGAVQREDARIIKTKLGCNVVRTHGCPSPDFIDECDKTGLMVIADLSGDGYIGDSQWREAILNNLSETITRYRNSPCIIAWGTRINDSRDCDELYFKTNKISLDCDATRQTLGTRNFMGSRMYEDIFGFNEYNKKRILSGRRKTSKLFVPYIITEHTGKIYPAKTFDNEERRLNHALRHAEVINKALAKSNIAGVIGMSFADFAAPSKKGSGDNINHFGVTDMFRNPKLAAYVYSSQNDGMPVMELSSKLSESEFCRRKLYAFTNCDFIKLYRGNEEINTFYPDKKKYKNLSHPPVIMEDLIGSAILNDGYTKLQSLLIKYLLKKINKRNIFALRFYDRLIVKFLRTGLKLELKDFIELTDKYNIHSKEFGVLTFKGYKGENAVIEKTVGLEREENKIIISCPSKKIVCSKTYEVIKIDIQKIDTDGNNLDYDFTPCEIIREGAVDIIGPKKFSLIGGRASVYVKSLSEGKGKVTVICGDNKESVDLEVIYENMEKL